MIYQTYSPNPDLNEFVKCYWTLEAPAENKPEKQRIVPDGCMEMIFHYGDLYRQYAENGSFIIQPACFVFGQITSSLDIEPTGQTGIFAIRFYPDGFTPFIHSSLQVMANKAVPLQELFGMDGIRLEKSILSAPTTEERIQHIEAFLLGTLTSAENIDRIAQLSVEYILKLNGKLSVDELSAQLNVNRRQLERKFSTAIGLSPKQLSKVIRLQSVLKMMVNKEFTNLASVAYEGEYYDQAHFIKDFKEFTGLSPKQFYAGNLKMSALFTGTE